MPFGSKSSSLAYLEGPEGGAKIFDKDDKLGKCAKVLIFIAFIILAPLIGVFFLPPLISH